MGKLEDIGVELHRMADLQFDGIKDCFNMMKGVLGGHMSDDEILDKLAETMQQVTGITHDTIKKQLADTKERISQMECALKELQNG